MRRRQCWADHYVCRTPRGTPATTATPLASQPENLLVNNPARREIRAGWRLSALPWQPKQMAAVGDRVQVASRKVGEAPREGDVIATTGLLIRVRWSTGEESSFVPSMGSLSILQQAGGRAARGRRPQSTAARQQKPKAASSTVGKRTAKSAVQQKKGTSTAKATRAPRPR